MNYHENQDEMPDDKQHEIEQLITKFANNFQLLINDNPIEDERRSTKYDIALNLINNYDFSDDEIAKIVEVDTNTIGSLR